MKRIVMAVAVASAAGLLTGVLLYHSRGEEGARGPAQRVARGSDHSDLWPVSRSWVWNVDPAATKRRVGLCVRTTESKIPPGTTPTVQAAPDLPPMGAERHGGWMNLPGGPRAVARVTCQVIDFREAGLAEAAGKQPLRLMARLRSAGTLTGISGPESVLAGESFVGAAEVEPRWAGDELHLLTVYTNTADTLFAHHVIVRQSDGE